MFLTELETQHFRNLASQKIEFDPKTNIFIGQNAQGKTNLLEAIAFLALTRSHRTNNDHDLINFNAEFARLKGQVNRENDQLELQVLITPKGKKAWVNRVEQVKLSKYVGRLNAIFFSPRDLELIKGSPTNRRRFMDQEFGQIDAEYLYFASQYRKVLGQRNNYLKQLQRKQANDLMLLDVYTDQLADLAAELLVRRYQYLKQLEPVAMQAYAAISGSKEKLSIKYHSSISQVKAEMSKQELYDQISKVIKAQKDSEIRQGITLLGVHRDDLHFMLDGQDAQSFASQGQQRSIALSLKLAEIELVHSVTGEYPLLLLDDVMSELDKSRQEQLLHYLQNKTQTFITTTDLAGISWEIIQKPKIYRLANGKINKGV
ncbi:MAG: DNA replication/repair protein RecF [Lactobacillus sp.]|nr:DNA replication/repair protein RecF [Lactobacillus sp.]